MKAIDESLDDKGDLSTLRMIWSEVVENLDRGEYQSMTTIFMLMVPAFSEAHSRQAFLATLTTDAISPLVAMKVRIFHLSPFL